MSTFDINSDRSMGLKGAELPILPYQPRRPYAARTELCSLSLPHLEFSDRVLRFELGDQVLLTSTTNGAVDLMPLKLLHTMPEEALRHLTKRGYFLKDRDAETQLKSLDKNRPVPLWSYIVLTTNCNLACIYCFEKQIPGRTAESLCYWEKTAKPITEMSIADLREVLIGLRDLQLRGGIPDERMKIVMFGGEPLLAAPPLLDTLLEYCGAQRWKTTIISNGTLVPRHLERFKAHEDVISDFRISLDGGRLIHDQRRPSKEGGRGSFQDVLGSIKLLLGSGFRVNMMTILGKGNLEALEDVVAVQRDEGLLDSPRFSWRVNSSHDYARATTIDDELTEAEVVSVLAGLWDQHPELQGKLKFETFRYLGHLASSFGWLGRYKSYGGPKLSFCDSQREFYYVFAPDRSVYHCPRSMYIKAFRLGDLTQFSDREWRHKGRTIFDRERCRPCNVNTLCGGFCPVREEFSNDNCRDVAMAELSRFVYLMRDKILERANSEKIVAINEQGWF